MQWSNLQEAVFDGITNTDRNLMVEAVAGSGKTTTIVEAMRRAKGHSIFLAFNKSIAKELEARGVDAKTFHSLCYGPTMRSRGANQVDTTKLQSIMKAAFSYETSFKYSAFSRRLVGLAKQSGVACLVPDTDEFWWDLVNHHELELDKEGATVSEGIEVARKLLAYSNESQQVDFDDMLYVPVLEGLQLPKWDFIFVDEAQDTNAIQRAILRKIMKPTSRIVAVGDPGQAIYGFRGADSNSLDLIAEEFDMDRLPLSVSYRCPQAVVEFAQNWVSHIQACDTAPQGDVIDLDLEWSPDNFKAGEYVVCRFTKPLLKLAFRMLRHRRPVTMLGREIGATIKSLIHSFKTDDLMQLSVKLKEWKHKALEKALVMQDEAKQASIEDKAESIEVLVDSLEKENANASVTDLLKIIDEIFADKNGATILSTIHKSKGLEADTIYWLNSSQCPPKWVKQQWQLQQERNLCYVAVTRAKNRLILIEDGED